MKTNNDNSKLIPYDTLNYSQKLINGVYVYTEYFIYKGNIVYTRDICEYDYYNQLRKLGIASQGN